MGASRCLSLGHSSLDRHHFLRADHFRNGLLLLLYQVSLRRPGYDCLQFSRSEASLPRFAESADPGQISRHAWSLAWRCSWRRFSRDRNPNAPLSRAHVNHNGEIMHATVTQPIAESSPLFKARMAGFFWLMTIITGMFGFVAGGVSVVAGDAATTAANIINHESLYRLA